MRPETVWIFKTARLTIALEIEPDYGYRYDGDDGDGETQRKLDSGDYVAFDSSVVIRLDGLEIGRDSLCGSVYAANEVSEFWTAHRSADPMNRNCSVMRAARGSNYCICHYFPSMVSEAIRDAREALRNIPRIRAA